MIGMGIPSAQSKIPLPIGFPSWMLSRRLASAKAEERQNSDDDDNESNQIDNTVHDDLPNVTASHIGLAGR